VLAGTGRVLHQVEVIVIECSLYPFQQTIPLIHGTIQYVVGLGFCMYDVGIRSGGPRVRLPRKT